MARTLLYFDGITVSDATFPDQQVSLGSVPPVFPGPVSFNMQAPTTEHLNHDNIILAVNSVPLNRRPHFAISLPPVPDASHRLRSGNSELSDALNFRLAPISVSSGAVDRSARSILPAPALPSAATIFPAVLTAPAVQPSRDTPINRQLYAPYLRAARSDVRPSPLLGRLVPKYIVARLPGPVAMVVIDSSLAVPIQVALVASAPAAAISGDLAFAPPVRLARLEVPARVFLQVAPRLTTPLGIAAPIVPEFIGAKPGFSLENSIAVPIATLAPRRLPVPGIPAQTDFTFGVQVNQQPPAPYIDRPVGGQFDLSNFTVITPSSYSQTQVDGLMRDLRSNGFLADAPVLVNLTISRTNVRYFNLSDAEAARVLADLVGAQLRDFTNFRPRPSLGTVEIWMAGTSARQRSAPAPALVVATGTGADAAILMQKRSLLDSLLGLNQP